ncbi:MAG: threonine synthase [Alphaproteobacteria bacterium]|nr:threonine synthase [Alphaproteobacteria bacterium]
MSDAEIYVSTRGRAPALDFAEVMLAGLARDGGLYVPQSWPRLPQATIDSFRGVAYRDVARAMLRPFVGAALEASGLDEDIDRAYAAFDHPDVTPLRRLSDGTHLLELFHGPTLAFKDVALQLLARLMDRELERRHARATIVGATSGDTGSAAIAAFAGLDNVDIVILHPKDRVSNVQRRQMTTVPAANVHNVALEGTFDDTQSILKALFNDQPFRDALSLAAVNSINWARIVPQTVYYAVASAALAKEGAPVFSVPTGNFGDIFAGYVAKRMGIAVARLIIATNTNDILARTLATGRYAAQGVTATMSPSMDIEVSSNFERLLFDAYGRDGAAIEKLMAQFSVERKMTIEEAPLTKMRAEFDAARSTEEETLAAMADIRAKDGILIDPHTAVGIVAARKIERPRGPLVVLATAHPAKFPDAVERATGVRPELPARLRPILDAKERMSVLPNDVAAVKDFVRSKARIAA